MHAPLAFASRAALMEAVAQRLAEALTQALTIRGAGCVALSGGTTPGPAYERLAARDLDWRHIAFALVDERFVPPDHEASNEAMLRRTLAPALADGAHLLPLYSEAPSLEAAAERAEAVYAPLQFDMALLGMGADGHIASWFPGASKLAQALDPANPRSVVALHAPQAYGTPARLSLTLAAIARARRVVLVIAGEERRARLAGALAADDPATTPAAALFAQRSGAVEVLWAA